MAGRPIDPKYLEGLTFRGAASKEVMKDGKKQMQYVPFERPVTPADVFDWRDAGAEVVIVIADGQKVTMPKAQKEDKKEKK